MALDPTLDPNRWEDTPSFVDALQYYNETGDACYLIDYNTKLQESIIQARLNLIAKIKHLRYLGENDLASQLCNTRDLLKI